MYSQVDALIFNSLLAGQTVFLPEVGSISVARHPSSFRSSSEVIPPYHTFHFSRNRSGVPVPELVSQAAGVDAATAEGIYGEWLEHASAQKGIVLIGGTGRIEKGGFIPTVELKRAIDPAFATRIDIPRKRRQWGVTILYLAAILAGAAIAFWPDISRWYDRVAQQFIQESDSSVEEVAVQEPAWTVAPAPVADSTVIAMQSQCDSSQVVPAGRDSVPSSQPSLKELVAGRSYAVLGVFREMPNAEAEIDRIRRIDPQAEVEAFRYGDKVMLSLFESDSRADCSLHAEVLRKRNAAYGNVWIYTH